MTSSAPRVWFITGASSGFGRAIATAALASGDAVVAAARRLDALDELVSSAPDRALSVRLDVTDASERSAAVDRALERFGRIDVLVNNAGRTEVGAAEETTEEELRQLFELHLFGPVALTRLVLPRMRQQGSGAIVQMSSMGGQTVAPGFSSYCATKFALEGWSETLAQEVAGFGIRVLIVEPGAFRTNLFGSGAARMSAEMPEYEAVVGPTRRFVQGGDGSQLGDPEKAAAAILRALDAGTPPLRLPLGSDAVDPILARLATVRAEVLEWEPVARATTFDNP
jgi:NAD(P)-dependent dehydrogenase (short-subunit alcohol dehydrogenase family)